MHPEGLCGREYEPFCAVCNFNEDPGFISDEVKTLDSYLPVQETSLTKQVGGDHYSSMKIQPVEFIVANNLEYRIGNVIKYACRHANKNGADDINKAIHYLEMIKETDYAEKK